MKTFVLVQYFSVNHGGVLRTDGRLGYASCSHYPGISLSEELEQASLASSARATRTAGISLFTVTDK